MRVGARWHGHFDDLLPAGRTAVACAVVAEADDSALLDAVHPTDPAEPSVEIADWRPIRDLPVLVVESWAAGDPSLRASLPSSLVSMLRVAGDTSALAMVNAALAAEFEGAVGLAAPVGDMLEDPGAVAARVAVEAAALAVIDEESGVANPRARMAIFQIPVLLNRQFLAVEHQIFEDNGGADGGARAARFTLHNLETGESPDPDELLDLESLARFSALAGSTESPVHWYPARPGVVLVYRGAPGTDLRRVVPWRNVLPLLPADSPLRAVAESVH